MSLYQRLGGDSAVTKAVEIFYERIMSNPTTSVFFEGVNITTQKQKQVDFFKYIFGETSSYGGREMRGVHTKSVQNGLNDTLYDAARDMIGTILRELGVNESLITEATQAVEKQRHEILNK